MTITVNERPLDLPKDIQLNMEIHSPIFSRDSSMSLPLSIPLTSNNRRALEFPDTLSIYDPETDAIRVIPDIPVSVIHSSWKQRAIMHISGFSGDSIEAVLYFSESNLYVSLESITLPQAMAGLHYGDVPPVDANLDTYRQDLFDSLADDLNSDEYKSKVALTAIFSEGMTYQDWKNMHETRAAFLKTRDFLIAPVYISEDERWLNEVDNSNPFELMNSTNQLFITAFLRLDFVLHRIFEKIGTSLTIDFDSYPEYTEYSSLFKEQWHSIVVLNNTMDALYPGCMYYSTLVPEMSCKDFLLAVMAQFGCTFILQPDGSYTMVFIETLLSHPIGESISEYRYLQAEFNSQIDIDTINNLEKITNLSNKMTNIDDTISTLRLEGVCQRTTTTSTEKEDITKSVKCPLAFAKLEYYYVPADDPDTTMYSYYILLSQGIEYYDKEDSQWDQYIEFYLRKEYFARKEGLFAKLNKTYQDITESFDKITINKTLSMQEITSFDFAKPLILNGRICWPMKLQLQLSNTNYQDVTIELIAPHKNLS